MALVVIQSWITPFVLDYLNWNAKDGQYMATVFWSGMVAGRIVGVLLLVWVTPGVLLGLHLVSTLFAVPLIYLAVMFNEELLWLCVPLFGFTCKYLLVF